MAEHFPTVKDYLEYVRRLHDRTAGRAHASGMTSWALLAALAYLVWDSVPRALETAQQARNIAWLVLIWAHTSVALECLWALVGSIGGTSQHGPFNYRTVPTQQHERAGLLVLQLALAYALPAVVSYLATASTPELAIWHARVLQANCWLLGGLSVTLLLGIAGTRFYEMRAGFPFPTSVVPPTSVAAGFFQLLLAPLLLLNLYFLGQTLFTSSIPPSTATTILATNLTFCGVIAQVLLSNRGISRSLQNLERLERDIVLHKLTEEEIKGRLETEYLGREIGGMLTNKVAEFREAVAQLQAALDSTDQRLAEISNLSPEYKHEIIGRFESLVSELEGASTRVDKLWKPLKNWSRSVEKYAGTDRFLLKLVLEMTRELKDSIDAVYPNTRACLEKVRGALTDFKRRN